MLTPFEQPGPGQSWSKQNKSKFREEKVRGKVCT